MWSKHSGTAPGQGKGLHRHWNWRFQESFFYPGSDLAFIDSEDIPWACGNHSAVPWLSFTVDREIILNWEALFRCMSDNGFFDEPMPATPVDLLGVHWAVEVSHANSLIWSSVHGMRMQSGASSLVAGEEKARAGAFEKPAAVIPPDWKDPVTVGEIRGWVGQSCDSRSDCHLVSRDSPPRVAKDGVPWPTATSRDRLPRPSKADEARLRRLVEDP